MRFWNVSPNVMAGVDEQDWENAITTHQRVFLGRSQDKGNGKIFANSVSKGDMVLIANGSNANKKVLLCGIVDSDAITEHIAGSPDEAQNRKLKYILTKDQILALGLIFDNTCAFGDSAQPHAIFELKKENTGDNANIDKLMNAIIKKINEEKIKEIEESLSFKSQIILQGPPGTGKTYTAKDLAYHLIFNEVISSDFAIRKLQLEQLYCSEQFKLIQFHPAYSYDDFVRGIIANTVDGKVEYKTENKILAEFAKKANQNFLDSKKGTGTISKESWVKEKFEEYKTALDSRFSEGKVKLNNSKAFLKNINETSFTYYHDEYDKSGRGFEISFGLFLNLFIDTLNYEQLSESPLLKNEIRKKCIENLLEDFKQFVDVIPHFVEATTVQNELKKYVLVIDEINRANIPAVLGELIYALEYRNEPVSSIYDIEGDRNITLPENLFIIGTMNTADRSVSQIDYAIRRRFAFVDVLPQRFVVEANSPFALDLFDKVAKLFCSEYIENSVNLKRSESLSPDFKPTDIMIGHSYFLAKNEKELSLKLKTEIKPILREYVKDGILIGETILNEIENL